MTQRTSRYYSTEAHTLLAPNPGFQEKARDYMEEYAPGVLQMLKELSAEIPLLRWEQPPLFTAPKPGRAYTIWTNIPVDPAATVPAEAREEGCYAIHILGHRGKILIDKGDDTHGNFLSRDEDPPTRVKRARAKLYYLARKTNMAPRRIRQSLKALSGPQL
jgi:hypothetical protein